MHQTLLHPACLALIIGAIVAGVLTLILFWAFPPHKPASTPTPEKVSDISRAKADILLEGVRLAELRLKELDGAVATVEKKAVQLIILCVALLGYLASSHIGLHLYEILKILSFVFLVCAGIYSVMATDTGTHRAIGLSPALFSYYTKDTATLEPALYQLLEKYQTAIEANGETQFGKVEKLRQAKPWLLLGVAFFMGWLVADNLFVALTPKDTPAATQCIVCLEGED